MDDIRAKYIKFRKEFLDLWYKPDRTVADNVRMNELEYELEKIEQEEANV